MGRTNRLAADTVSYNGVLGALRHTGRWVQAGVLLHEMHGLDVKIDTESLGTAVGACEPSGHWQYAISLLEKARDFGVKAEGLCLAAALGACEQAGQHSCVAGFVTRLNRR